MLTLCRCQNCRENHVFEFRSGELYCPVCNTRHSREYVSADSIRTILEDCLDALSDEFYHAGINADEVLDTLQDAIDTADLSKAQDCCRNLREMAPDLAQWAWLTEGAILCRFPCIPHFYMAEEVPDSSDFTLTRQTSIDIAGPARLSADDLVRLQFSLFHNRFRKAVLCLYEAGHLASTEGSRKRIRDFGYLLFAQSVAYARFCFLQTLKMMPSISNVKAYGDMNTLLYEDLQILLHGEAKGGKRTDNPLGSISVQGNLEELEELESLLSSGNILPGKLNIMIVRQDPETMELTLITGGVRGDLDDGDEDDPERQEAEKELAEMDAMNSAELKSLMGDNVSVEGLEIPGPLAGKVVNKLLSDLISAVKNSQNAANETADEFLDLRPYENPWPLFVAEAERETARNMAEIPFQNIPEKPTAEDKKRMCDALTAVLLMYYEAGHSWVSAEDMDEDELQLCSDILTEGVNVYKRFNERKTGVDMVEGRESLEVANKLKACAMAYQRELYRRRW